MINFFKYLVFLLSPFLLECDIKQETAFFDSLFPKLKSYVGVDAQTTIQWIIDGQNHVQSMPCDLRCMERTVYVYGVLGSTKLKSEVSSSLRELFSKFIDLDVGALKQYEVVSPDDMAGMEAIGCHILKEKNQLLRQAYCSPYLPNDM